MKAELPLFKNGEHNSESACTIDRVITPLIIAVYELFLLFADHIFADPLIDSCICFLL